MTKKAASKRGKKGKKRRAGLWAVTLIVIFQILGWSFFSVATPGPVEAATFAVNSPLDETDTSPGDGACSSASGFCTLRAAIQEANALPGPDVITLKKGLYMLTIAGISENGCATGDLDITDSLTIAGKGVKDTFINGGKLDRVLHIIGSISVTIKNVTIQNGLATDDGYGGADNVNGGGILNETASTLLIKGCTISNNAASGGVNGSGGGIYNAGGLTITESTLSESSISNNAAKGGSAGVVGGALYNAATLTIKGSVISKNIVSGPNLGFGGGIFNQNSGMLEIQGSTISNNIVSASGAYGEGGGIFSNGNLTIRRSTISNNTAQGVSGDGGGIFNGAVVATITNTLVSRNIARGQRARGGGIASFWGHAVITGSTLSHNAASAVSGNPGLGGGIALGDNGTLTVQAESRIVRNFSSDEGGGIFCYGGAGTASISADSTVAKNIPDDIYP